MDVSISEKGLDPEWDNFLQSRPDGLYHQSSLWAKKEALAGREHVRLVVRSEGQIVGGAQIFLRSLPLVGFVGYIPKGPVIAFTDPAIRELILNQIDSLARAERIRLLTVRPAEGEEPLAQRLVERGAQPSIITSLAPTSLATWRTDLRPEPDRIMADMAKSTRKSIRRAERKGVTFRLGTEADLPTFIQLRKNHAKQLGYDPGPDEHYYHLWSTLSSGNHFRLSFAEYDGQVLAAKSHIAFGDTMLAHFMGDSGLHRNLNAHSFLHWKGMLWGREHGYTWYDFGGIGTDVARAILDEASIPDHKAGQVANFKRSFGGQVAMRPGMYDIWPGGLISEMMSAVLKMKPVLNFLRGYV